MAKNFVDDLVHTLRPEGPAARLAVLLGTIEMARERLIRHQQNGGSAFEFCAVAGEEMNRIIRAKDSYDLAAGIQ